MEKRNIRYGVVNDTERTKYEKKFHVPYGYAFMTFKKGEAIAICRKKNDQNFIVEEIFDNGNVINFKQEIYRSGGN